MLKSLHPYHKYTSIRSQLAHRMLFHIQSLPSKFGVSESWDNITGVWRFIFTIWIAHYSCSTICKTTNTVKRYSQELVDQTHYQNNFYSTYCFNHIIWNRECLPDSRSCFFCLLFFNFFYKNLITVNDAVLTLFF